MSFNHITDEHHHTSISHVSSDVRACIWYNSGEYAVQFNIGYRYTSHSKLHKGVCRVVFSGVTKSIKHEMLFNNSGWSSRWDNNHEFYQ
jgi:hypothetical protein